MARLTEHDINVLAKIKDPEANIVHRVKTNPSLLPDPNVIGDDYETAKNIEVEAIRKIAKKDAFGFPLEPSSEDTEILLEDLTMLIGKFPKYASARNNRVQIIRTIHGDGLLVSRAKTNTDPEKSDIEESKGRHSAELALSDLVTAINLLTETSLEIPISPRSAQTLGNLHTQKATIYNRTAKLLATPDSTLIISVLEKSKDGQDIELKSITQFEDQAYRDFQLGAWYGNELAEKMVTATNPMAKLCGEIVSNAMRKEMEGYGSQ